MTNRFEISMPTDQNINPIQGCFNSLLANTAVIIGATETPIPATALNGRREMAIYNADPSNTVYLGATGLSSGNGFHFPPESKISIPIGEDKILYGICSTGLTATIRLMELG